ncbi:MAG: cation:proton antiporter subunit C [Planctomycetota bacterium]|jgi:multicomponent Na+:H+ antiporter subunit C
MLEYFSHHYAHVCLTALIAIGFFGMVAKRNFVKKLIGMSILQSAIILFWIVSAYKENATIPILEEGAKTVEPADYMNPLPHTLMLTAIVVAVVTSGVAIALLIKIHRNYGTLEEDTILDQL